MINIAAANNTSTTTATTTIAYGALAIRIEINRKSVIEIRFILPLIMEQ